MSRLDREMMNRLVSAEPLGREVARAVFRKLVRGELDEFQAAGIVAALKVRGERAEELVGAAEALLEAALPFPGAPVEAVDIVGTGGDGMNTLNVSTLAAVITAALGIPVAKHGNRSVTSLSGSFDLLCKLGVKLESTPEQSAGTLRQAGLCFLFAPQYHAGLRHVSELRTRLNTRTIFNLLGPLVNPARPRAMVLGVALPELLDPMAEALRELGCRAAAVVHGSGLDEVAVHAQTEVRTLLNGKLQAEILKPRDFGLDFCSLEGLTVDSAAESHARAEQVLAGHGSDAENAAVAMNAALAAKVFHGQGELPRWTEAAMNVLKSGEGLRRLKMLEESGPA